MIIHPMIITFFILLIVTLLFIQSKFRPDLIAVGSLLALTILGILTPEEALSGFSNPVVIMIAGLFVVGAGIFDSGLARNIGNSLLRLGGNSERKLLFILIVTVGLFSAVLSSTGTVAVLLPVIISIALEQNVSPSRFLLPLTFASSLGGLLTIIGTPPNLVVSDALVKAGYENLGFFALTGIGIIALMAGLVFMMTIGRKLLPNHAATPSSYGKSLSSGELAGLYKVYDQLHFVYVPEMSDIVGERLADLKLPLNFEITVIEIERINKEKLSIKQSKQAIVARANEIVHPHDLLLVFGGMKEVERFVKRYELEQKSFDSADIKAHFLGKSYGMTEILIAPHSSMEDQTIVDAHFREKYSCNVLAINRKGEYIHTDFMKEKLKLGDALLIHGKWEDIEMLSKDKHDVVILGTVSEEANIVYSSGKSPIAAAILAFMLILLIFEVVSPVMSVSISAFLMIATGCIRSIEIAYKKIQWESVILISTMLPMAIALEKTGGVQFISNGMLNIFGNFGPYGILISLYLITTILSQFISNTATAIILAPIAITTAIGMGISPYPLLVCVAVAASMSFSTPVASPTNALVMTAGGYKFNDFVRVGVPLQIFVGIFVLIAIPLFFPF
ncbi:SLC13 family permease [Bacillus sp. JJ722]|uniref:SLC13 family permease n=1 Tax=Bacillus sp. JJ722 TaxID=3122973 RepID=UPI002FFFFEA9